MGRGVADHGHSMQGVREKEVEMRTLCDGKQGEVQGLSEVLSSLSSELRDVQDQLKAKGDRVSDTSPVQELRAATKRLRDDNVSLELRIGESLRLSVPAATACGDSNQTNESNESNETYTTNQSALCVCVCVYPCTAVLVLKSFCFPGVASTALMRKRADQSAGGNHGDTHDNTHE